MMMSTNDDTTSVGLLFDTFESLNEMDQFLNGTVSAASAVTQPTPTRNASPRRSFKISGTAAKNYISEKSPNEEDVLCGRGARTNRHPGNRIYLLEILKERPTYVACKPANNKTRDKIAAKILDSIHQRGGRFLQLEAETGRWFVLKRMVALIKVKQALRDRHAPKWAEQEQHNPPATETASQTETEGNQNSNNADLVEFLRSVVFSSLEEDGKTTTQISFVSKKFIPISNSGCYGSLEMVADRKRNPKSKGDEFWDSMFVSALAPLRQNHLQNYR